MSIWVNVCMCICVRMLVWMWWVCQCWGVVEFESVWLSCYGGGCGVLVEVEVVVQCFQVDIECFGGLVFVVMKMFQCGQDYCVLCIGQCYVY